ncbi:hypothetical protein BKA67DRAFT_586065, partial [Truncatella angustata]
MRRRLMQASAGHRACLEQDPNAGLRKRTVQILRRMSARLRCRTPRHRLSRGRVVRAKAHGAASAFWAERRAGKLHTRAT